MLFAAFAWLGCSDPGGGGAGGSGGTSGTGAAGTGASGTSGSAGTTGAGGDAGTIGSGGTGGAAGTTGTGAAGTSGAGTGGAAGTMGTGGVAGATGSSGRGGTGGGAGTTGGAGRGGAGAGGAAGSAGRGGTTGAGGATAGTGGGATTVSFTTRTLSTQHTAEGADVGDINGDGVLDLVAGPTWYAGPNFAVGGTVIANPPTFTMNQYSKFFLTFVDDVSGDGLPDVIAIGDAGGANQTGNPNAHWYQNPGSAGLGQPWPRHAIFASGLVANESPGWVNVAGDAKKELLFIRCQTTSANGDCGGGQLGYARPGADPTAAWTFTPIGGSYSSAWVHGLGAGDIDGDGLPDVMERTGWWQQSATGTWTRRAFEFWGGSTSGRASNWGGSQMYAYDIDGDGNADVVSANAAHGYGLFWFQRSGTGAAITFTSMQILPTAAGTNNFSQLHATQVADVNRDGLPDVITGKRYYAHPSTNPDPGTTDPAVISWFELQRGAGTPPASARFVQHVIHSDSGIGCNFVARDVTGDGKVDVFTTSKRGTFLHVQQ